MADTNSTPVESWTPSINWQTPAGEALQRLIAELPGNREWTVTLFFGSSPLQLTLEPTFTSADVDLFVGDQWETSKELEAAIARCGLEQTSNKTFYIQGCMKGNFRTSPRWEERAFTTVVEEVRVRIPHPTDILIAKLHRLEEKDLRAFRLVIDRTGHPTEDEMKEELQAAVDLYRPNFDEEMVGDITTNTAVLWEELWGKQINVRQEIIAPALAARRKMYDDDQPRQSYKDDLRRLGEE